ncbi:hypothetical protein D4Q76_01575 [archaeon]|nr:MAG: hypothetical protein D4Q76_01575 [archaeon]
MHYVPDNLLLSSESEYGLELLKETPRARHSEIERVGSALKNLKRNKNPKNVGGLAWRAKGVLEKYNPQSEDVIIADANLLLEIVNPRTLYCMFEKVGAYGHMQKHFPKNYKISEDCKRCFYDENFSAWMRGNRNIETVAELVGYALALEGNCSNKKENLSICLAGSKNGLLDKTKEFADVSLKTESIKAIANSEATNVWSEMNRKLSGEREIGYGKPKGRKVYTSDPEVRKTRETRLKHIELRKLGLSNAADELDVRIIRAEDLIMPETLQT